MRRFYAILVLLLFGLGLPVVAQESLPSTEAVPGQEKPLDWLDDLGGDSLGALDGGAAGGVMVLTGELTVQRGSRDGILKVKAVIPPKWHTYAVDQQGGPGPSKISVKSADKLELLAPFRPDRQPKVREVEEFEVPIREHYGEVVWSAPVRLAEDVDPEAAQFEVQFDGIICDESQGCKPLFGRVIKVEFGGYYEPTMPAGEYRPERSHVTIRGYVHPSIVQPGGTVKLVLTAVPDTGYHVYAYAPAEPEQGTNKPTLIVLKQPASWSADTPQASSEPIVKESASGEPAVPYHDGSTTWTAEINVPEDVANGDYDLAGLIGYQTCTDRSCDRPTAAEFAVKVSVGDGITDEQRPLAFAASSYGEAARLAATHVAREADVPTASSTGQGLDLDKLEAGVDEDTPTALILLIAFAAGLILNFMPCVLPVIGLKIMAFVQQAGDSRGRIFTLNLWYSLGVMAVFMALATMVVVFRLKWADQFTSATFNVVLTSVVFVFALSFLGVWEIPIPGFVGTGKAQDVAEREGVAAAFVKGILATVLATPCAGPLVVPAVAWAVKQPPLVAFGGFACVGLGMASPYLVIGLFPRVISFLPKPGAWMETFKQIMGFILLGTVVWILTFVPIPYVIPTVAFIMGLWAAFWWIGRTPLTESLWTKLRAWIGAAAFATLIGLVSFAWLLNVMESRFQRAVDGELTSRNVATAKPKTGDHENTHELPWLPYSLALLQKLTAEGKTVFVDFTADW